MLWDPEKQDRLEPEVSSAARFIGNLFYRQLKNSRHTTNGPAFIQFFAYEQRQNKIMDTQLCFADEISQSGGTPQAPRAMHQSSHAAGRYACQTGSQASSRGSPKEWRDLKSDE